MKIILLERIRKLGQMGDVVNVKNGFARNYLLPYGKALRSTSANREQFEREKSKLEAHNLERKSEAETIAKELDGKTFLVIRQASDSGQLFGSVGARDIVQQIKDEGIVIERRQVMLDKPIKTLGNHPLTIALHPEVESGISINVARSEEEAERQARGEDVLGAEIEEAVAVEKILEDKDRAIEATQALFEDGAEEAKSEEKSGPEIDDAGGDSQEVSADDDAGDGGDEFESKASPKATKRKSKKD